MMPIRLQQFLRRSTSDAHRADAYALSMAQGRGFESRVSDLLASGVLRVGGVGRGAMLATALSGVLATVGLTTLHLKFAAAELPPSKTVSALPASTFVEKFPDSITVRLLGVQAGLPPRPHRVRADIWRSSGPWWHPDGTVGDRPGHPEELPFDPYSSLPGNGSINAPSEGEAAYGVPYAPYRFAVEVEYPARLKGQIRASVSLGKGTSVEETRNNDSEGVATVKGMYRDATTTYQNLPLSLTEYSLNIEVSAGSWDDAFTTPVEARVGTDAEYEEEIARDFPAATREFSRVYITNNNKTELGYDRGYQWYTVLVRSQRFAYDKRDEWRAFVVDRSGRRIAVEDFGSGHNAKTSNGTVEQDSYEFTFRIRQKDIKSAVAFVTQKRTGKEVHFDHIALRPKPL